MTFGPVRRALLALAVAGFAIGTGEFVMLGLLPQVAADLGVSIPAAGRLISAYALGVVVGAPLLTAASVRFPRKPVLLVLMSWYAVGNLLSALAPSYGLALVARFVSGLPHGAFFGVGAVIATGMVDRSRSTRAMSVMFAGLTVATIVGVPATTLLGQQTSWRFVYGIVAAIALVSVPVIAAVVPAPRPVASAGALRAELRVFADPQVWLVLGIATVGGAGLFASFSYITPMMTQLAGYSESSITWLLVIFGLGMTVGNLAGAPLADRAPMRTLTVSLVAETAVALVFVVAAHDRVASAVVIFLFPLAALAGLPALQAVIIDLAGGAPNLAAASMQAAFNVANSLGAYLGGLAITAGYGYAAPNAVAAALVVGGIGLTGLLVRSRRHRSLDPVVADSVLIPA